MEGKTAPKSIDDVTRTLISFPVPRGAFFETKPIEQKIISELTSVGICYLISMGGKDAHPGKPIAFCFREDDVRNFSRNYLNSQVYEVNFLLKQRHSLFNQVDIPLNGLWTPKIADENSLENESLRTEQGIWQSAYPMPGTPGIPSGQMLAFCDNKERANRVARTYQGRAEDVPIIAYYVKKPDIKIVEFSMIPNPKQP
ncbi:MAG: hypothetical protein V1866_06220 [archaeon]